MKNGQRLSDAAVRALPVPAAGAKITYDGDVAGFGVRLTAGGARAFILNYRTRAGRERRFTIGGFPSWSTAAARKHAADLKAKIRGGHDPLGDLEGERSAPTIARLCDRFVAEHMGRLRPATAHLYRLLIDGPKAKAARGEPRGGAFEGLRRSWGSRKVADITPADVEALHARVTRAGAPYVANRLASLSSRLFALSIRWGWRADNPVRGLERNDETKRTRYLRPDEIASLTEALAAFPDQQAADIVRMLVLTGARRNEVLAARWDQFDLGAGVWTKPGASTKQKTEHRTPISAAARQLLADIPRSGEWVFPGNGAAGHRAGVKSVWPAICRAAGLVGPDGKPNVRVHDLRHTYASLLASAGLSLPIIGAMLGHTQPGTTARYAHLLDDPLRAAAERVGAIVTGGDGAEVVPIGGGGIGR